MQTLRWLRAIGDTVFAARVVSLAWFVLGLKTSWSLEEPKPAKPRSSRQILDETTA